MNTPGPTRPNSYLARISAGEQITLRKIRNVNLRQHAREALRAFRPRKPWPSSVHDKIGVLFTAVENRSNLFSQIHPRDKSLVAICVRLAAYSADWVRQPDSWRPAPVLSPIAQLADLIRHLLACYPMSNVLTSVWDLGGALRCRERDWFGRVGRGESASKIRLPATLSRRALAVLGDAPSQMDFRGAMRWAQIKTLGGSDRLVAAILETYSGLWFDQDEFWLPLFEMMAADQRSDVSYVGLLCDYLHYLRRQEQPAVRLRGRSLDSLVATSRKGWVRLLKVAAGYGLQMDLSELAAPTRRRQVINLLTTEWHCWLDLEPWSMVSKYGDSYRDWQLEELCTQRDLALEGKEMHHCVASYGGDCLSGTSSIWSLRVIEFDGRSVRKATIEINRRQRRMVQVKACWNEPIDDDAAKVISRWAMANRIDAANLGNISQ